MERRKGPRVAMACAECRKRRERCDGAHPTCGRCRERLRPCSYIPGTKRGPPNGYVRGLEVVLGLMLHGIEEADAKAQAILRGRIDLRDLTDSGTSSSYVDNAPQVWQNSATFRELKKILEIAELDGKGDESRRSILHRLDCAFTQILETGKNDCSTDSVTSPSLTLASSRDQPVEESPLLGIESPPWRSCIPPCWSQLLEIYFTTTHCWFPILLKDDCYRAAYILTTNTSPIKSGIVSRGDLASLMALFAFTANLHMTLDDIDEKITNTGGAMFQSIHAKAMQLVQGPNPFGEIGHVHALLILTLLELNRGNLSVAWSLVGKAVNLAAELGLIGSNQDADSVDHNERSKRTVSGCFIVEILVAMALGRRPYSKNSDIERSGHVNVEAMEEWEPQRALYSVHYTNRYGLTEINEPGRCLSIYNNFADLIMILNDIIQARQMTKPSYTEAMLVERLTRILSSGSDYTDRKRQTTSSGPPPHLLNLILARTVCLLVFAATVVDSELTGGLPHLSRSLMDSNAILEQIGNETQKCWPAPVLPFVDLYWLIVSRAVSKLVGSEYDSEARMLGESFLKLMQKSAQPIRSRGSQHARQYCVSNSMVAVPPEDLTAADTSSCEHPTQVDLQSFYSDGFARHPGMERSLVDDGSETLALSSCFNVTTRWSYSTPYNQSKHLTNTDSNSNTLMQEACEAPDLFANLSPELTVSPQDTLV